MAKALRNAEGQALRIGTRAQTACSDCCGDAPLVWAYRACPCSVGVGSGCAIPDEPCIFVDSRSVIAGVTGEAIEGLQPAPIIRHNGICYTVDATPIGRCYPFGTEGQFCIMPEGTVPIGGPGVVLDTRENCVDGCAEINVGPEYFEAFVCNGCGDPSSVRYAVCARAVGFWNVIYDQSLSVTLCVDRTIGYTLAQVLAWQTDNVQVIDEPTPLLVWQNVRSRLSRVPAPSCCFSDATPTCLVPRCESGVYWDRFGSNGYFPVDVCCGSAEGVTYRVDFRFQSVRTNEIAPGDVLTTTISAVFVGNAVRVDGRLRIEMILTTRSQRPAQGVDTTSESPVTIDLDAECCVNYHPQLPKFVYYVQNDNPVQDVPGTYYFDAVPIISGSPTDRRRAAWTTSPWGLIFQLAYVDGETEYSSVGTESQPDSCAFYKFRHTETAVYSFGVQTSNVSLDVFSTYDQEFPCSYSGPCGSGGWGQAVGGTLP